jgi:riboflavin synthase
VVLNEEERQHKLKVVAKKKRAYHHALNIISIFVNKGPTKIKFLCKHQGTELCPLHKLFKELCQMLEMWTNKGKC